MIILSAVLPPLPYAYNALEPHISAQILELHHDKHHAAYVAGYNQTQETLGSLRSNKEYSLSNYYEQMLAFNGSGDILHTIYWDNMIPNGFPIEASMKDAIDKSFGSFEQFKDQFTATAAGVKGSGWAALVYNHCLGELNIIQIGNHENTILLNSHILLVCDVWEHAYYLQYKNNRAEYIKAWWNVVNWADVEARHKMALTKA